MSETTIAEDELLTKNILLLSGCPQDQRCVALLNSFSSRNFDADLNQALSHFLLLFTRDAPVSAILCPRFSTSIRKVLDDFEKGDHKCIIVLRNICPELAAVMYAAKSASTIYQRTITDFIGYLLEFVEFDNVYCLPLFRSHFNHFIFFLGAILCSLLQSCYFNKLLYYKAYAKRVTPSDKWRGQRFVSEFFHAI